MSSLTINYIYDQTGEAEYAVVPFDIWQQLRPYLQIPYTEVAKPEKLPFEPAKFRGILRHLNLNIEQELNEMRNHRYRNI